MGRMSDLRALRAYRDGNITYNEFADRVGILRMDEVAEIVASPVNTEAEYVPLHGYLDREWRGDWVVTRDDAPLIEVLWGANCERFGVARETAVRIVEHGWESEHLDIRRLESLLYHHDLRHRERAEYMADLIESLGWTRPEPEPAEAIGFYRENLDEVMRWLGRDGIPAEVRAADSVVLMLRPEEAVTGRVTAVWPGSILHRVGHLVEVLTPDSPESTVQHEHAVAEEPENAVDPRAIRDHWVSGPGSKSNPDWEAESRTFYGVHWGWRQRIEEALRTGDIEAVWAVVESAEQWGERNGKGGAEPDLTGLDEKGQPEREGLEPEPDADPGFHGVVLHVPVLTQEDMDRIAAPFLRMTRAFKAPK